MGAAALTGLKMHLTVGSRMLRQRNRGRVDLGEILIAPTFDTWQNTTNHDTANEKFAALMKSLGDEDADGTASRG